MLDDTEYEYVSRTIEIAVDEADADVDLLEFAKSQTHRVVEVLVHARPGDASTNRKFDIKFWASGHDAGASYLDQLTGVVTINLGGARFAIPVPVDTTRVLVVGNTSAGGKVGCTVTSGAVDSTSGAPMVGARALVELVTVRIR